MRSLLALLAVCLGTACAREASPAALTLVREDPTDEPIAGATAEDRRVFHEGDRLFERVYRPSQGLGPVFIQSSCRACHGAAGRGPGSVTRMVAARSDAASLLPFGTTARPQFTAGASRGVLPPTSVAEGSLQISTRMGPAVFGRGWIEAVSDAAILAQEALQTSQGGAVSGRANRLPNGAIGRLGVKARLPDIETFTAEAFQGDMGMTSPRMSHEVFNPDGLTDDLRPGVDLTDDVIELVAGYVRRLAIPARRGVTEEGQRLFREVGCAGCHVPSLMTRADYSVRAMAGREAEVYSDLLLHDMGAALADGVSDEGDATGREWRTAPLIGLRFFRTYLHDGRARSLDEAITLHGGSDSEARDAVRRYRALPTPDRARLLTFVRAL